MGEEVSLSTEWKGGGAKQVEEKSYLIWGLFFNYLAAAVIA